MKKIKLHVVILVAIIGFGASISAQDKGTCTVPYATLTTYADYAAADAAYTNQQQTWSPDATGTINTYAKINSGSSGKVGFDLSHNVGAGASNPNCVGNAQREVRIFPASLGACNWATGITFSLANGGNGCTWSNPEFYGLVPNTDYIVQVRTIIPASGSCAVQNQYLTYYQIIDLVTCSTCATATCPVTAITATTVAAARTNMTTALSSFTDSYTATLSPGQSQTICVPVTVPVGSTVLGFKQKATSSPSGCANATEEPVTYQLRPASDCSATPIPPSTTNASSVSSGFNPEWDNLAAGNYILCYTMTVSASAGCSDVTVDRIGYYNVIPTCSAPSITSNPVSKTICSGESTTFNTTATGSTSYQWQVNTGSGWNNITNSLPYGGATTSTLTVTGANSSINNTQYQCIIQGRTTGCPDTTTVAILNVSSALAPIYSKTSTDVTCAGPNTGSITLSGVSSNTAFNWVSGPIISPIPTLNKPGGATDERALINLPAGTYCVNITRNTTTTSTETLFTEEWETGATNWTINNGGGNNIFVINSNYPGGSCVSGAGTFTVPTVPNQPVAVPGSPTSNYLHIMATTTTGATCGAGTTSPFPPLNANFDGVVSDQKVTLNTPINTTGLSNVAISFYCLAKGDASGNDYGAMEYSTNGGTIWTQVGAKLYNQTTWISSARTDPSWANQTDLRFRIRWINNATSSTDPPLAIDHIVVTADATTSCDSTTQECFTLAAAPPTITPAFTQIAAFCQGTTAPVLPTTSTNAVTGTWNSAVSNNIIGPTTYTFTPTAGQCALTATMTITVNPAINANITGNSPICATQSLQLTATPAGAVGYTWSGPNSYTASIANVVINPAATSHTGNYQVTVTGTGGCTGTASYAVVVNAASLPTYNIDSTGVTCAGPNTGTITFSVISPSTTFNWISGPVVSPIPASNLPAGSTDERALVNIPTGTYCVEVTRGGTSNTTQTLFTEEFETGATNWTISNAGGPNLFVINNIYPGGSCVSGAGTFTVPVVPNQPVAVPGNPTSNYLHIMATTTTGATCGAGSSTPFPPLNANFDGVVSDQKVTLNTPINTTGLSNITINFYWLAKGDGSGNDYGAIEYSTNGGTIWTQVGAKLYNQTTWTLGTRSDISWANQADLRFRVRWINNATSSTDPPLAIDHIVVTGEASATCSAVVTECITVTTAPPNETPTFAQVAPFCEGEIPAFLPTSSTNTPTITGIWNSTIDSSAVGTTTYTFTPTLGQCANSATMDVLVKAIPNVVVNPFDTSICLNTTIILTASGADSYLWSPNNDISSTTGNSVSYSALFQGNKIYKVIGTTNGCSDSAQVTLHINPLPVINLSADQTNGCEPLSVEFTLTTVPVSQNITWNFGNGSTSTLNPTSVNYNYAGVYNVSVSVNDVNGCTNNYLANNYITVYPTPNVDFNTNPDFANIGELIGFTSTYTSIENQYEWNFGDGFSENSTPSTAHAYSSSGQFVVEHIVTSEHGCKDSISKSVEIIRPIVLPNIITPDGDGFNDKLVFTGLEGYEGSKLQMYNRWGRGIYTSDDYKNDWTGDDHPDGTYFYILTLNEKYKMKPFHGSLTIIK